MGVIVGTYIKPCLKIDSDGYKRYEIGLKIRPEFDNEGPASALLNTAGVPIPGTIWAYGDEVDASVWCSEECEIEPVVEDECVMYKASFSYTNKPKEGKYRRCNDERFDNPLLETPKVRVTYKGKKTKATKDRFGLQVKTSSHEIVRGSATEFDDFNAVVTIEQNVPVYVLAFNVGFINRVNDRFLYGMPPRTILCKNVEAEERFFGSCYKYWNRKVEFEVDYDGFDKDIVDEGTKVLKGAWSKDTRTWVVGTVDGQPANPYNPTHFDRFLDAKGNPAKVILDGLGKPFRPQITDKCSFCGYSAPQQYQVFGLFDTSLEGIGGLTALSSQSVILDHSGVVPELCQPASELDREPQRHSLPQ